MLKRLLVIVVVVVLLAVGLGIGALFVEFRTPGLGQAMLAEAGSRIGIALTASDFRFRLSRGLRIQGVRASIPLADGGRLDVEVQNLILEHELLPLLRRKLVFDTVVLDGATFHLEPAPEGLASTRSRGIVYAALPASAPVPAPRRAASEPRIAIEGATVRRGLFTTKAANGQPVEVRGIAIDLEDIRLGRGSIVAGLEGQGTITADSMTVGPYRTGAATGNLTLGSGHIIIEDFAFPTEIGPVNCKRVDVDLRTNPFRYSVGLVAQPLDVAKLLGSVPTSDNNASLDVSGTGTGTDPADFDGWGTVKLDEGTIPPAPALMAIDRFLSGDKIVGSHYDEAEIRFHLSNQVVSLEPFELSTDLGNVAVRGSFQVDGRVNLDLSLRYPRDKLNVKEIPTEVVDLLTDSRGEIAFPILVSGTMSSPDVHPDWDALRAMAREGSGQGILDRLKEKIGAGIEKLLGTKKDK